MAEPATPPPSAAEELGYINPGAEDSYRGLDIEHVPELTWPRSVEVYDRMRRSDSQVGSVLMACTLPILSTPWRINPAGASPEVVQFVAQQLNLPVIGDEAEEGGTRRAGRFSWDEHLELAMLSLPFGHMFFEQVLEPLDGGRWGLRKLAPRMPRTIRDILVARDGGLVGIVQKAPSGQKVTSRSQDVTIPVDRLVAYTHKREGGDWAGTSLLRVAYKNWMLKDELLQIESSMHRRNGMGVPVYTNPADADPKQIEKGRRMANSYRAGDNSGASIPFGSKLELKGVSGQLPNPRPVIEYHDNQIGKSALAHFLNLDGGGGSYALSSTQAELFVQSLTATARRIASTANQHIVADLVDWNFGPGTACPVVEFDDMRSTNVEVSNSLRTLTDAGLIRPDRSIEDWLRREMGAPAKDTPPPTTDWSPDDGDDEEGSTDAD